MQDARQRGCFARVGPERPNDVADRRCARDGGPGSGGDLHPRRSRCASLEAGGRQPACAGVGREPGGFAWLGFGSARILGRAKPGIELLAVNGKQRMRSMFTAGGVRVSVPGGGVGLALRAFGRGDSLQSVSRVNPTSSANQASYARGGLVEWYANGPLGLEPGMTLRAPPAVPRSNNDISLSFALTGRRGPPPRPAADVHRCARHADPALWRAARHRRTRVDLALQPPAGRRQAVDPG